MTLYGILNIVYFAFFGLILVPVGVGLLRVSRFSRAGRWVWGFLLLYMLNEVVATVLMYSRIRNHFMMQSDTLILLWASAGYFTGLLSEKGSFRASTRSIQLLAGGITFLLIVEVMMNGDFNQINTGTYVLTRLMVLAGSFLGLRKIFDISQDARLGHKPDFWYCIGFFIFSFFSAITGAFEKQFIESSLDLYYFFDTMKVIAYGASFAIFAIGLDRDAANGIGRS
jgi:hypothetical protein